MSNADTARAFLRGEIDANHYWRESGEQQVKSAGVFLAENQQQRVLKNLSRLVSRLQQAGICELAHQQSDPQRSGFGVEHSRLQLEFDQLLATYK